MLLRGAIRATFKYPDKDESDEKLGLYVNNGGGWNFLATERNRQTHTLELHKAHTLGTFGVLRDDQPPKISRWRTPFINGKGRPVFSFSVRDNLSGVDDDEINVFLNGERIIPEYDPRKKRCSISLSIRCRADGTWCRSKSRIALAMRLI